MATNFKCTIDPTYKYNQVLTGTDWLEIAVWDDGTIDIELNQDHRSFVLLIDDLEFLLQKAREADKDAPPDQQMRRAGMPTLPGLD